MHDRWWVWVLADILCRAANAHRSIFLGVDVMELEQPAARVQFPDGGAGDRGLKLHQALDPPCAAQYRWRTAGCQRKRWALGLHSICLTRTKMQGGLTRFDLRHRMYLGCACSTTRASAVKHGHAATFAHAKYDDALMIGEAIPVFPPVKRPEPVQDETKDEGCQPQDRTEPHSGRLDALPLCVRQPAKLSWQTAEVSPCAMCLSAKQVQQDPTQGSDVCHNATCI